MKINETMIVSAFPGTGKTYCSSIGKDEHKRYDQEMVDADSSKWPREGFPGNYLTNVAAKCNLFPTIKVIFISSHESVRELLAAEGVFFTVVYPERGLKDEYLDRYRKRGDSQNFIESMSTNWDDYITSMELQGGCQHIALKSGEYLSDYFKG